jgi:hypothetical protein
MNTARIVVLTIAVGAGGGGACPAHGMDTRSFAAEPGAHLPSAGTLPPAPYSITDLNAADTCGNQAPIRGSIKLVCSGVSTPAMAQK